MFSLIKKWKLTDLTVKRQITDSISENLTDSDLESEETKYSWFISKHSSKWFLVDISLKKCRGTNLVK